MSYEIDLRVNKNPSSDTEDDEVGGDEGDGRTGGGKAGRGRGLGLVDVGSASGPLYQDRRSSFMGASPARSIPFESPSRRVETHFPPSPSVGSNLNSTRSSRISVQIKTPSASFVLDDDSSYLLSKKKQKTVEGFRYMFCHPLLYGEDPFSAEQTSDRVNHLFLRCKDLNRRTR